MKRAKRLMPPLAPSSKGNTILSSSKHSDAISLQGNPSFGENNNCFVVDELKRLRIYLLEQLIVVKELLEFTKFKEKTFVPSKEKMQKERNELEGQVLSLTSNFQIERRNIRRS
jgi:hypothetical protein